jgi:hypothetical protein
MENTPKVAKPADSNRFQKEGLSRPVLVAPTKSNRYTLAAIVMHWLITAGVLVLIAIGLTMAHGTIAAAATYGHLRESQILNGRYQKKSTLIRIPIPIRSKRDRLTSWGIQRSRRRPRLVSGVFMDIARDALVTSESTTV